MTPVSCLASGFVAALLLPLPRPFQSTAGSELRLVLEGSVVGADGAPVEHAWVSTSAGGRARTDARGGYRLELDVPVEADQLEVAAIGTGGAGSARARVSVDARSGTLAPLVLARGASCEPSWLPTFGAQPGVDEDVHALAVFDDGSGPALYAGGTFLVAGGTPANRIARWDGTAWTALGSGMNGAVEDLVVHDDGSGAALYACGSFTSAGGVAASRVARWDGTTWSALGSGLNSSAYALASVTVGGSTRLYAGGDFSSAGGVAASRIARWDGASWAALGAGVNGRVETITGFAGALFAGGSFTTAGGGAASHVARWNGSAWSALGSGTNSSTVEALVAHDDGSGPALFVGGDFTTAGGIAASGVARWNGASWSALGAGISPPFVRSLVAFDSGSGPELYAGGWFFAAGGQFNIARWNGSAWASVGIGANDQVRALARFDDGGGEALYAGGEFYYTDNDVSRPTPRVARWDGADWSPVGEPGLAGIVLALAALDDGGGPALLASGALGAPGGSPISGLGRWDGAGWADLAGGVASIGAARALVEYDSGAGPELHAGGTFVGGAARWNGATWTVVGAGLYNVFALALHDAGGGPELVAGGTFTLAGGAPADRIVRWDGAAWVALGSGMDGGVLALIEADLGAGPQLFAAGAFTSAGGTPASRIARWTGAGWVALGGGLDGIVRALAVFDDGSGTALYAAGAFANAGGVPASRIARWDGASWSAVGSGTNGDVNVLAVHDDGDGPALYAGGVFTVAGGIAASRIARWDGAVWSPLGGGVTRTSLASVDCLAVFDDGSGPDLYVGGFFSSAIDSGDSFLARWGCLDTTPPVLECPAGVVVLDRLGSPAGESVTFTVTATDDVDPTPSVVCVPPSGTHFPRGTTLVQCTATDAAGNTSQCSFPVTVELKARKR
ncbi:MAG TPA: HYR domain-containing protein [Planctomycetota bacterium]